MFHMLEVEDLLTTQGQRPSRGPYYDMRAVGLDGLLIFLDAQASKKHTDLDGWHVLAEPFIFLSDLESELTSVAHDKYRDLTKAEWSMKK